MSTVTRLEDRQWVAVGKFCRQTVDLMGSSVSLRARTDIDQKAMTFPRITVARVMRMLRQKRIALPVVDGMPEVDDLPAHLSEVRAEDASAVILIFRGLWLEG